jgi:hypothetical protein
MIKRVYNEKESSLSLNESEHKRYGTLHKGLTFEVIRSDHSSPEING